MTFVFTDIEGSTRLFQTLGADYEGMLADHHGLLRAAFAAHGGHEIKSLGDGFFFALGDVGAGVAACVDGQRSLMGHSWPESCQPRVRMGVHTTECVPVDGDYVAVGAHQAARVMAAAHGGQILVSDAAAQLVTDLPSGARLDSLGLFRLKDFDDPIELYQAGAVDLPVKFPAVRALPAAAHNVPPVRRPLVGREADLANVRVALDRNRLVTIVGPGGVGKTSVAVELVRELALHYPDGAWLVDLAPVTDGDTVVEAVAATVGVAEAGASALEALLGWLRTRRLLMVVDNCEQVIDACGPLVDAVLDGTSTVNVLATSREPLNIAGERVYRLEPLALSVGDDCGEHVIDAPAVRLFLERAAEARPGFEPDPGDLEAAAALCHSVDGLPLAIELAAAHVRVLSPAEVHAQLLRGAVLRSTARGTPVRHRSLAEVIDWSYQLLDGDERAVFRGCAVFAGGFTLDAAEAVLVDRAAPSEVLSHLYALYDKSLLQRSEGSLGTRFRMLEPVRQFAADLLATDERAGMARRHAAWALRLGEQAQAGLRSLDQRAWLDRCDEERANLATALEWMRDHGERRDLTVLAVSLADYWYVRGPKRDGLRWLLEAIDSAPDERLLVAASAEAAKQAFILHEIELSERIAQQVIAAADRAGMYSAAARAWHLLASFAARRGDSATARHGYDTAVRLARQGDDPHELVYTLVRTAVFEAQIDDIDAARAHIGEATRLADQDGTPRLRTVTLDIAASLAFDESRFADSLALRREALELSRALGDSWETAWLHMDQGCTLVRLGEYRDAAIQCHAALRICQVESLQRVEPWAHRALAELAYYRGEAHEAVSHALDGLSLGVQIGQRNDLPYHLAALAEALVLAGQHERAAPLFGAAAAAQEAAGVRLGPVERRDLESAEARTRAALGTRYDELFAAGCRATSDEELRALVRREQAALMPNSRQP